MRDMLVSRLLLLDPDLDEAGMILLMAGYFIENRPGTSQVADAVNSGKGLP